VLTLVVRVGQRRSALLVGVASCRSASQGAFQGRFGERVALISAGARAWKRIHFWLFEEMDRFQFPIRSPALKNYLCLIESLFLELKLTGRNLNVGFSSPK